MRTSTIAGNWKMYKNPTDTRFFFEELRGLIGCSPQREVVICPPYLDIEMAVATTRGSRIQIGAQISTGRKRAHLPARFPDP